MGWTAYLTSRQTIPSVDSPLSIWSTLHGVDASDSNGPMTRKHKLCGHAGFLYCFSACFWNWMGYQKYSKNNKEQEVASFQEKIEAHPSCHSGRQASQSLLNSTPGHKGKENEECKWNQTCLLKYAQRHTKNTQWSLVLVDATNVSGGFCDGRITKATGDHLQMANSMGASTASQDIRNTQKHTSKLATVGSKKIRNSCTVDMQTFRRSTFHRMAKCCNCWTDKHRRLHGQHSSPIHL